MSSSLQRLAPNRQASVNGRSLFSDEEWGALAHSLKLSSREFQIVQGLFDDESEGGIAVSLRLSHHTVHTYLARLYRKLGVSSRCQLLVGVFGEHRGRQARAEPR